MPKFNLANIFSRPHKISDKQLQPPNSNPPQYNICPPPNNSAPMMYTTQPYAESSYLQMAIGAYLTPSANGYKCVDPYFLSQGDETLQFLPFFRHNF